MTHSGRIRHYSKAVAILLCLLLLSSQALPHNLVHDHDSLVEEMDCELWHNQANTKALAPTEFSVEILTTVIKGVITDDTAFHSIYTGHYSARAPPPFLLI